jgi:Fic family protein
MQLERFAASPIGNLRSISGTDGRTGREYSHAGFVAHPLGAEPALQGSTWRAVTRASRALAHLDQASRLVPNPRVLRRPTLSREAQSTSALEGTFAPIDQVLAADSTNEGDHDAALNEVLNYVDAADASFDYVCEHRMITTSLIAAAHLRLVDGTESDTEDAGRIRRCQVAIGSPDGTIESARFVPMPPGAELDAAVRDLVDWTNVGGGDRDPLVAAAMTHYQFESLHPFNDGNGRLGRLLIVLQFMVDGLLQEPLLSVSPWIRFFSSAVEASAIDTASRVNLMLDAQRDYVKRLHDSNYRGGVARDIVEALVDSPIVRVPALARRFGKTPQGIEVAIKRLTSLEILVGPFGSYGRYYVAPEIYRAITHPHP